MTGVKEDEILIQAEVTKRRQITSMLIMCYFIIKTLVYEILNNPESTESLFQAIPKAEKQYFPLFGFTFIVLSIEFLFDKFSQYLHQQNPGKNEDQIKQMLY